MERAYTSERGDCAAAVIGFHPQGHRTKSICPYVGNMQFGLWRSRPNANDAALRWEANAFNIRQVTAFNLHKDVFKTLKVIYGGKVETKRRRIGLPFFLV